MCLNLSHCRYVALGDLVMVLHVILQGLIVIVLHFLARHAANFRKLVCLVVSFGHSYLVLRI